MQSRKIASYFANNRANTCGYIDGGWRCSNTIVAYILALQGVSSKTLGEMKKLFALQNRNRVATRGAVLLAVVLLTSFSFAQKSPVADAPNKSTQSMNAETVNAVRAANDQFYAGLNAMFTGNLAPLNAIWSHGDDISNQGPFGDRMDGWAAVGAEFTKEAGMKLGGRVVCKDLIVRAGKDFAYTVCVEAGENMSADGKSVKVNFRATNVFRLENGEWKLCHHHTDLSPELGAAVATPAK